MSLIAWVVNAGCCALIMRSRMEGKKFVASTMAFVGSMQLLEAGMWMDQPCGDTNKKVTNISRWQVALQPLVFLVASYLFLPNFKAWMAIPFLACSYVTLPHLLTTEAGCGEPCKPSGRGLVWTYTLNDNPLSWPVFVASLAVPALALPSPLFSALIVGSFVVSLGVAYARCSPYDSDHLSPTSGSVWCLIGAFIPVALLLNERREFRRRDVKV